MLRAGFSPLRMLSSSRAEKSVENRNRKEIFFERQLAGPGNTRTGNKCAGRTCSAVPDSAEEDTEYAYCFGFIETAGRCTALGR
jgi:hypothetical protein